MVGSSSGPRLVHGADSVSKKHVVKVCSATNRLQYIHMHFLHKADKTSPWVLNLRDNNNLDIRASLLSTNEIKKY